MRIYILYITLMRIYIFYITLIIIRGFFLIIKYNNLYIIYNIINKD